MPAFPPGKRLVAPPPPSRPFGYTEAEYLDGYRAERAQARDREAEVRREQGVGGGRTHEEASKRQRERMRQRRLYAKAKEAMA